MRRGNGDGSVYKLSGKRRRPYAVRVTVGYTDEGRQQYKYIGYYASKTDAKKALTEYLVNPKKTKEVITLKHIYDKMTESSKFSENTLKQYNTGFNKLKDFHNTDIDNIKIDKLEELFAQMKPAAQSVTKKVLSNCYLYAMKYDHVKEDLSRYLEVNHSTPKKKQIFTIDDVNRLWKNLGSREHDDIPLILLYSGMRISELLSIRKEHVNLIEHTMFVEKSKTAAGIRHVPIHDEILPLIQNRYEKDNDYLISHNNKQFNYLTLRSSHWYEERTMHEARHTFITYMNKCGVNELSAKRIVGHADKDITEHYTHRDNEELLEAINQLKYE